MSVIRIDIASEFKEKGFKKAEKSATLLDSQFKKLGSTIAAAFSTRAIYNFGREAVKAFSDDQQAAARFEQALKGVNLGFASPEIERYLESLEKQTGVLKDQLRPAYQTLAQTTRSVNQSQDILNTAMDVAAGTGIDLQTVVSDLSKSYLGNNASLSKYNIGLSKTELRTTSFKKVQELLNKQFSGQRAAYLETYAGKLELINVSYNKMQDTIGGALLDSFSMLIGDGGIGGATSAMERFGMAAADAIRGIGVLVSTVTTRIPLFDQIQYLSQFPQAMKLLNMLIDLGKAERPLFFPTAGIGQPAIDAKLKKLEEEAIKRQKELEKLRKKTLIEQEKANRLKRISIALMEKEKKFDLTRIQLQAALQGKLTDKERARVEELMLIEDIKQAVQEQNVDKAEELLGKLEELQSKTEKLALSLTTFPKAEDPFIDWTKSLIAVQAQLAAIAQKKIVVDFLANFQMTMPQFPGSPSAAAAAVASATSPAAAAAANAAEGAANELAGDAAVAAAEAAEAAAAAAKAQAEAAAAAAAAKTAEEAAAAAAFQKAADEAAAAAVAQAEAAAALEYAAAKAMAEVARLEAETALRVSELLASEAAAKEAADALLEANNVFEESVFSAMGTGVSQSDIIINVNVAGNVTAEQDLAETVYETFLGYQKSGKGLLYSSVAI